ncbi:uncharacterized protein LOC120295674 [Eucalyptus grandis]|uniref:uncharacterized protein LOC120295674 n=1 Tax=Eucalyptus grandis TaxID=71139 RepID=UPI00192EFDA6|nr:uncharacterized protein LOC120295674 [Eucalyptus grandis]
MRDLIGQQAHNQAAVAAVAEAALVSTPVATPAEVQPENVLVLRERSIHKLVEQFLKLNSLRFNGTGDPEAASLWVQDLENAFALLMCTEAEKVVLAVYQLQGNANAWWRATRGLVFPKGVVPVWDAFLRAFNDKYFSRSTREQKMEEFQCLRQGAMTVDQYEVKFAKLS